MSRTSELAAVAILAAMVSVCSGCTGKPTPQGSQTIDAAGARGQMNVRLTGPASVSGKASLEQPAMIDLTLGISGPAGSKVHIIGTGDPSNGCHFDRAFTDVTIGGDGVAESKGVGFLGRAEGCTFEATVVLYASGHDPEKDDGDDVARPRITISAR